MPDPFDAIRQTVAANQDAAAGAQADDAFTRISTVGRPDPLRAAAYLGPKTPPERAARIIAVRDRTRLPADLIDRNLDEIEAEASKPEFDPDTYRKASPKVAAWLEDPANWSVAQDDLPHLAAIERLVSTDPNYRVNPGGSISGPYGPGGYREFYRSTGDMLRAMRRAQLEQRLDREMQRGLLARVREDFGPLTNLAVGALSSTAATAKALGVNDSSTADRIAQASSEADPGFLADVQRGVGGLIADAPLMLAGAALTPLARLKALLGTGKLASYAAGAAATGIAVQPLAIREGVNVGQEHGWANGLTAWGIETVIPAAFGATGSEKIITALAGRGVSQAAAPGLARVAGGLLLQSGLEATEEAVTEYAHAIHEAASGIDPGALDPDRLWRRLAVAGAVGGVAGAGFNLPEAIGNLAAKRGGSIDREAQRLIQAAGTAGSINALVDAAKASATAGRSPEAARTLFQTMMEDQAPTLYVDREAWDAFWRGQGKDPRGKLAAYGGDPRTYDEAARTGAPLALKTGHSVVEAAQDEAAKGWIAQEARLDPGMMNAREAEAAVRELETLPDDPEAKVQRTAQEAAQAVQDDFEQQLLAAGYDAGAARRNAAQMAAAFRTLAARWNAGRQADDPARMDARTLAAEWNVGINRPLPEVLTQPTTDAAGAWIAAARARLAGEAANRGLDAERMAAQEAADKTLAQEASGDAGWQAVQEATAALEAAGGQMTMGDAMRALGAAWGFRPDAGTKLTTEQARRGNLLAAALRVRGKSLTDLLIDAGIQAPSPTQTTAAGARAADDPALEKLAAQGLRLVDLVAAIRAGKGDLAELEQASALAAEVGPALDRLPLDQGRIDTVRAAVEYAQDGTALNQGENPTATPMSDAEIKALVDHFGTTNDIKEAGYILPDGRMLDFTGRHQTGEYVRAGDRWATKAGARDWMKGQRQVDHREIPSEITPAQGGDAINWMLERGAIRIDAGTGSVHAGTLPNGKQAPLVRQIIDMHDGEVGVDLNGGGFRDTGMDFRAPVRRFNKYYNKGTKGTKIIGHMRRFFSGENLDADTLFQPGPASRRGSITFNRKDGQRVTDIRLFGDADLSTVLHESGHLYLEMLLDLAGREGAPAEMVADRDAALAWLGAKDGKITTEMHEKWARGFEAYLLEGKAPSAELRGVFARFAAWMAAIYHNVKNLAVDLTPEVRGVFDRLLATNEEIAEAQAFLVDDPLFDDATAAGMTPAEFAAYQKAREDARRQAEDGLRTELMRELEREKTAAYREIRAQVALEVESEVNRDKRYVAEAILRRGTLPGGVPLPPLMPAIKLDTADLKRRLPAEASVGPFRMMHTREGGIPVDQAAGLLGFGSADEMLTALAGLRPRKQLIEAETDVRMRQRFGDSLTDGSIAEKAMAALHNERKADVHLAEVKALAAKTGRKAAPMEVMREAARRKVAATPVKDLLPQIHARAERKARQALEKALAKQDFNAAWIAKQQEMLAGELFRATIEAKREAEQIRERVAKLGEQKTRERIGKAGGWEWTVTRRDGQTTTAASEEEARAAAATAPGSTFARTSGYLEQIDGLLERYSFRRESARATARMQSLREWVALQQAAGAPVNIPESVLNNAARRNWREVPLDELRGLGDALANIAHLAKKKNELSKAQRERELEATAAELVATLTRTHPRENRPNAESKPALAPRFLAAHRKAANIAREMDGDEDAGPFWEALIRPINDAGTAESRLLREAKEKQDALWKRWAEAVKGDGWPPGERRPFAGFKGGLTRLGGIMVALNWGNEGNRQRLLEGGQGQGKLTEAQVLAVIDSLTAADLDLVEGIWEHIDSYWSEIAAIEQRTTGVAPAKVEPSPFPTRHGTIKGGYFPIVYDDQETGQIDGEATDLAKQIQAQAFGRTATAHGHTKARTIGQGRRLNLDAGVIGQHLTRVVHDLTHREALADAMRVLLHPEVRAAIDARMGNATTRVLRQWIADIATGGTPPDAVAQGLSWLRRGFSISTMGFRATTAALQLTGFSNSAVRVGPGYMAKGIAALFSSRDGEAAWRFVETKSAAMRERAGNQTRELSEMVHGFQRSKAESLQAAIGVKAFWLMQQVQTVVDRATWLAAYQKALDESHPDADAVAIADQAVIDTQSGGQTKDLAGVQRSAFGNLLTGAYTYGSLVFNQLYDQGARVRRNPRDFGTWAGAFGNATLALLLPAAASVLLRGLMRNDWPDDDKDSLGKRYFIELASSLLGTMLITRELGGAVSGYDFTGPATMKPIKDLTALGKQAQQGDLDTGLARAVLDTAGSALGLPSAQAWATGSGLMEWLDDPSLDVRPIIFGPAPHRR